MISFLSVPDDLGGFSNNVRETEQCLLSNNNDGFSKSKMQGGGNTTTIKSEDMTTGRSKSFHGGIDDIQQRQVENGLLAHHSSEEQPEMTAPVASEEGDENDFYLPEEDGHVKSFGVNMDSDSLRSVPSGEAMPVVKEEEEEEEDEEFQEPDEQQERARQAVALLADLFHVDTRHTLTYKNISPNGNKQENTKTTSNGSPKSVMGVYDMLDQDKARLQPQPAANLAQVVKENDCKPRFRLLQSSDRANSLPAKIPGSFVSSTCLKSSLKSTLSRTRSANNSSTADQQKGFSSQTPLKRTVSFGALKRREFNICLSDHPSCSYGPPISLGWQYQDLQPVHVDEYENERLPRRSREQMVLSCNLRRYLLLKHAGYKKAELAQAIQQVDRVKHERLMTDLLFPLRDKIDETLEDVVSKVKKMFAGVHQPDTHVEPAMIWLI